MLTLLRTRFISCGVIDVNLYSEPMLLRSIGYGGRPVVRIEFGRSADLRRTAGLRAHHQDEPNRCRAGADDERSVHVAFLEYARSAGPSARRSVGTREYPGQQWFGRCRHDLLNCHDCRVYLIVTTSFATSTNDRRTLCHKIQLCLKANPSCHDGVPRQLRQHPRNASRLSH